ncbi:flagellar assembly protein FliH [Pseudomonas schmalbachii]|uniref:Flagellar assembly protein FliH n=1 Tax=Pseudomonas schmalbachii TaxID=2816993 RepID=A0ABS3TQ39_9PSED|nr:flagellar assembly protein FliH [Pseudomonas schmalbachii]MBO3275779.1 flagellar assembly protein FliH [Pseudomonas schmalbachii]
MFESDKPRERKRDGEPGELIRARDVAGFDLWSLPSFDPVVERPEPEPEPEAVETPQVEEVPVEEVKPLTLEELEAIRQDAYNEGFATGEKDGFHAGQLKARQEAETALQARLQSLETLMNQLFEPIAEQDQLIEQAMLNLVQHVVRQVIQRELSHDSSHVRQVLREALKLLPMGAENIRIMVNPQDFELIKALRDRHEESWRILEDDALLPGGCRIETEHTRIDASIETRLAQATKQLLEQQREQATHPLRADLHIELEPADAP